MLIIMEQKEILKEDRNLKERFEYLIKLIEEKHIEYWDDLGNILSTIQKDKDDFTFKGSFEDFMNYIEKNGIAFITFEYGVDGVSTEIIKYTKVFRKISPKMKICLIGGEFNEIFDKSLKAHCEHFKVEGMTGFTKWKLFETLYRIRLSPEHKLYCESLKLLWNEVLYLTRKIGEYLIKNNIGMIYAVNTNSNPGNISLAFSVVLLSEFLQIPVINNNHDFYWEAGKIEKDLKYHEGRSGPRDLYFTNHHLKEFFSIMEVLYPWKSRKWLQLNINERKSKMLVKHHDFEEQDVSEIGTAIDTDIFKPYENDQRKTEVLKQLTYIFAGHERKVSTKSINKVIINKFPKSEFKPFITGFEDGFQLDLNKKNLIFLQPTRIIERKKIEVNFIILTKLFNRKSFWNKFYDNSYKNIIFLISGPMIVGHEDYYLSILKEFKKMLYRIEPEFRKKVFLSFLFSNIDMLEYYKQFDDPIKIHDLFNIASMITLPSETEGRGLPIIEAAACKVPIITRRYYPEEVYSTVIGEYLSESDKLKVIEFKDEIHAELIDDIIIHLFEDKDLKHNRKVIQKRFNFTLLENDMIQALKKLYRKISF